MRITGRGQVELAGTAIEAVKYMLGGMGVHAASREGGLN